MRNSILHQKSYAFALRIITLCKHLMEEKKEYILSKQVLRSGTSIGAMIRESEFWQSRADFLSKLSIGLKEANETEYWISLLFDSGYIGEKEYESIHADSLELIKMLVSSVKTTKSQ